MTMTSYQHDLAAASEIKKFQDALEDAGMIRNVKLRDKRLMDIIDLCLRNNIKITVHYLGSEK
jgi:hypothetical protein